MNHSPENGTFQIEEATIAQIQKAFQKGEVTPVQLVQMYMDLLGD